MQIPMARGDAVLYADLIFSNAETSLVINEVAAG